MVPLIVLRPEPGASATVARARALGLDVVSAPLFETVAFSWTPPAPDLCDAVMMTSANAARLGGAQLSAFIKLPLYAVGAATAAAAHAVGFSDVRTGPGDAAGLMRRIAADRKRHVLDIGGRDRTPRADPSFEMTSVVVYASDAVVAPAVPGHGVVLLHSVRAASRFREIARDRYAYTLVAIAPDVQAAAGTGWAGSCSAESPDDAAMLALAARLCEAGCEMRSRIDHGQ